MKPTRLSCICMNSVIGDTHGNLGKMRKYIGEAASDGADIVLLPELCLTGYAMPESASYRLSEDSAEIGEILDMTSDLDITVCFGYADMDRHIAHMVAEDGHVCGIYHKTHLGERESGPMTAGDSLPVIDTKRARIGVQTCWEVHFPEITRRYALDGADIVLMPHASGLTGQRRASAWERTIPARAYDNTVFAASCNLCGDNGLGTVFGGGAMIFDHRGLPLAKETGPGPCILSADLDPEPMATVRNGTGTSMKDVYFLDKRRPELYRGGLLRYPFLKGNVCRYMQQFVGREKDLQFLQNLYDKAPVSCSVSGRKHLGKTTLLQRFCEDKDHIYLTGIEGLSSDNLQAINKSLSAFKGSNISLNEPTQLFDALKAICGDNKVVVVLDRYADLKDNFTGIENSLKNFLARTIMSTKIFLVVCDADSSIFARFYHNLELRPMSYLDCKGFHPEYTPKEHLLVYSLVGGTPAYQNMFGRRPEEAIEKQFFNQMSPFNLEAEGLVNSEANLRSTCIKVLSAIASGNDMVRDIAVKSDVSNSQCLRVLEDMENKGLVSREETSTQPKRVIYSISSNILKFHYEVVKKHMNSSPFSSPDLAYEAAKKDIKSYLELMFKQVCIDFFLEHSNYQSIGKLRSKDGRSDPYIDFVAWIKEEGIDITMICSCRLDGPPIGPDLLQTVKDRSKPIDGPNKTWCFFSGCGYTEDLRNIAANDHTVQLVSLADVYR
ncbi:MAG: hypothetical protein IJ856_01225 [Candidatus Methanomethylophilaceae archaeon]|nr:hypothetical protein [Candidatus Methanomethylophilaceae archaeon]